MKPQHTNSCPIHALIQHMRHIQQHSNNLNTILGYLFPSNTNKERTILASDIKTAIKSSINQLGLNQYALQPEHVGSHSLRAGGAITIHLNGIPHNVIKKNRTIVNQHLFNVHSQTNIRFPNK